MRSISIRKAYADLRAARAAVREAKKKLEKVGVTVVSISDKDLFPTDTDGAYDHSLGQVFDRVLDHLDELIG